MQPPAHSAEFVRRLYLSNAAPIKSGVLRIMLIEAGIKEAKCEICGLSEWMGMPIPLELHHKNCNHFDNSEDNVMILCPTCHAQITRHIADATIEEAL